MSYFGGVHMERADSSVVKGSYYGIAPEFTAVLYHPDDKLGLVCAFASLVPVAILIAHLSVFLCRRTADDLFFAGGQVFCEAMNVILKLIIRQPRPITPVSNMPADSFGMPSSHAQFMGFTTVYLIVKLAASPHIPVFERILRAFLLLVVGIGVAFSRYYLWYHTGPQVTLGFFIGAVLSLAWLWFGKLIRRLGLWQWFLTLWPCRIMYVKDADYDVRAEYAAWKNQKNR